jgi:probable rRNA maturation factor
MEKTAVSVNFCSETDERFEFDPEAVALSVVAGALSMEGCPFPAEVSLTMTGGEQIRSLNRDFRGIDRETDVLSFPMIPWERPSDFDSLENFGDCFDPDEGRLMLGDIVISVPRMKLQAEEYGHAVKREFAFLVSHSTFHLLGYDHMEPEEAREMEEKQEAVLQELGIGR